MPTPLCLADVFNVLRYVVQSGIQWRMLPHDFPPWEMVYQQSRRWLAAGVFDHVMGDLHELLREVHSKKSAPTACILDSRTLQSMPDSGSRAGFDAGKKRKGSKLHLAVDTLGYPLAMQARPMSRTVIT